MTNFRLGLPALPLLAVHARCRGPVWSGLMVISPGPRFALPHEGLFNLELGARTQCGPWWAVLEFVGPGRRRVLVLCDQLDRQSWRRLRLTVIDSA